MIGYSDDMNLIVNDKQSPVSNFISVKEVNREVGLSVNEKKTKCMVVRIGILLESGYQGLECGELYFEEAN